MLETSGLVVAATQSVSMMIGISMRMGTVTSNPSS
jgi:hypothetical protein